MVDDTTYFGHVGARCFLLRGAGYAVARQGEVVPTPFVAELGASALPYHEEVVRCTGAAYGTWRVAVVNWSTTEEVDYEIAILGGAFAEQHLGTAPGTAAPHAVDGKLFWLNPPPRPGLENRVAFAGATVAIVARQAAVRLADPVSHTFLGFNKAAYEGLLYRVFPGALGLQR